MNKKMTVVVALAAVMGCGMVQARPHGGRGGFGGRPRPAMHHGGHRPPPPPPRHHHGGSVWGRGGRNFWPGFVGGMVGGVIANSVVTTPVVAAPVVTTPVVTTPIVTTSVVAAPAYTTQQVWVEGRYIDQVQPNGTVVRVWQAGHYETRQVLVQ